MITINGGNPATVFNDSELQSLGSNNQRYRAQQAVRLPVVRGPEARRQLWQGDCRRHVDPRVGVIFGPRLSPRKGREGFRLRDQNAYVLSITSAIDRSCGSTITI